MTKKIYSAEVWLYKEIFYLRAYSVTVPGIRYSGNNPIHILNLEDVDRLPEEIMKVFNECQFGIPNPDWRTEGRDELLDIMKFRSYKEQAKKAYDLLDALEELDDVQNVYANLE